MDKQKALEMALGQIEKAYGKGSIMKLGDAASKFEVPVIPTGSLAVDMALGIGGIPRGRVSEVYGPESSGKTTLALQVIAEAQKMGGIAAFIDVEHALDPNYAQNLGVRTSDLYVAQPDTGEQGLEIVETLVRSNAVDVVVIDSVAAMVPRAEIEGEMGDSHVGLQARLMSQALRKLTGVISKSRTAVIFINQVREKIGVMFGNPETTPGGRALKFYASVRMEVRKMDSLKQGSENVGNRVKVKVVKNKLAPPLPDGRVRHPLRQGHLPGGEPAGRGPRGRDPLQGRHLVLLRGHPAGPGAGQRPDLPGGEPRGREQHRAQGPRALGSSRPSGRGPRRGSGLSGTRPGGSDLRERALRILQGRDHSRQELRHKLLARGAAEEDLEPLFEDLVRLGYLDDQRFALQFIREKARVGWGRLRILEELATRGLDRDLARRVLDEEDPGDEEERAGRLADERAARGHSVDSTARFLARRGFPASTVRAALRSAYGLS